MCSRGWERFWGAGSKGEGAGSKGEGAGTPPPFTPPVVPCLSRLGMIKLSLSSVKGRLQLLASLWKRVTIFNGCERGRSTKSEDFLKLISRTNS